MFSFATITIRSEIRGHLARRENILKDDNVSVLLDPFQDHRIGVLFIVNPAGVQADAAWSEANGQDYSYDQVWDSEGQVTDKGWMALMAIPFRSLRFRPNGSDWGVVFGRNFPRNSETDIWPHIAANISGVLTQEATLKGIQGVTGSHNVQINPYVLGQNERTLETLDPLNPYFSSRHLEGTAGGEVKAILKDSIVFDATDQSGFQRRRVRPAAVYRQSTLSGVLSRASAVFSGECQLLCHSNHLLLYTRNIVHPEYGGRVTGKDASHEHGPVCYRRPGAGADGGSRRCAL